VSATAFWKKSKKLMRDICRAGGKSVEKSVEIW